MKEYKLATIIFCIVLLFASPFAVNGVYNLFVFDYTKTINDNVLCEWLMLSFYPEIFSAQLFDQKTSALDFGTYDINLSYTSHGIVRYGYGQQDNGLSQKTEYQKHGMSNKAYFSSFPIDNFTVDKSMFNNTASWNDIEENKVYFAYFQLTNPPDYPYKSAEGLFNDYATSTGDRLIEWVGFAAEDSDCVLGWPVGVRRPVFQPHTLSYNGSHTQRKTLDYLSKLGIFGNALEDIIDTTVWDTVWESSIQENSVKAIGFMMYGNGSFLREFQNDPSIRLVRVRVPKVRMYL